MRFASAMLISLMTALFHAAVFGAEAWQLSSGGQEKDLTPGPDGVYAASFTLPGEAAVSTSGDRRTFRPGRADFDAGELSADVRLKSGGPVSVRLFVKDKDGLWFGTEPQKILPSAEFRTIRARLDRPGMDWTPAGHHAPWSVDAAVGIFTTGLLFYGDAPGKVEIEFRPARKTGKRVIPKLRIVDWRLPAQTGRYEQIESRFRLTREYFNPFDPAEIRVDFEVTPPSGGSAVYPAFYARDYVRSLQSMTRETVSPKGLPFWAFRFTPKETGPHRLRIVVQDRTPGREIKLVSPWKTVEVQPSKHHGFVRPSRRNKAFFELSDGTFYYPVGVNIHTNIDLRSEYRFKFGHQPDRGTFDYEMYFEAFGKAGVNTVEVWFASWTYALEWNSASAGYGGLGRYNLGNAWRFDRLLDSAGKHGIRINLVLDNHGKNSVDSDQEWNDNPFNAHCYFAKANGGFLEDASTFFKDEKVKHHNDMRNRYIAARWGADPRIFAVEQWSEVDLNSGARPAYEDGTMLAFHQAAAEAYTRMSQGPQLITTHVCSDWRRSLEFRKLFELSAHTHWAGDAYRGVQVHIADQMRGQFENIRTWKPVLITEYGGTASGAERNKIVADIHGGLWSSLFTRQAGTPFLWWHDYIFIHGLFQHYRGFTDFLQGIDLRAPGFREFPTAEVLRFDPTATAPQPGDGPPPYPNIRDLAGVPEWPLERFVRTALPSLEPATYDGMMIGKADALYGWVFCREALFDYPAHPEIYFPVGSLAVRLPGILKPGDYRTAFFDPFTGQQIGEGTFRWTGTEETAVLPLPPFRIDIAFKILPTEVRR